MLGAQVQINITWDASVANAPAGYKAAVQAAVAFFEQTFTDPVTVNIAFGWGEVGGQSLTDGSIGASLTAGYYPLTYAQLKSALGSAAGSTDDLAALLALPVADPTGGATFAISSAQAKALNLIDPAAVDMDGYVGLDAGSAFTFDPNARAAPGLIDAIGALEHEISEVLGRVSGAGQEAPDGSAILSTLDLFRFSSAGVRAPSAPGGWFSADGKNLSLPFDNPSNGGDAGDWSQTVSGDAFDAFGDTNRADLVSATDLQVMDLIGYRIAPAAPPATPATTVAPTTQSIVVNTKGEVAAGDIRILGGHPNT